MNIKFLIWTVGILLVAVAIGIVWYIVAAPEAEPEPNTAVTLPTSGSITPTTSTSTTPTSSQMISIAIQGGKTMVVRDFLNNGTTIPDTVNPGRYMLAGNLGYCSNPNECQAAPADNFNIYYNSVPQSFTIALTKEPIGPVRLNMEEFMLTTLGITEQQLCNLNYFVGVTIYVNPQYTGKNLGFSFCPGATVLPK